MVELPMCDFICISSPINPGDSIRGREHRESIQQRPFPCLGNPALLWSRESASASASAAKTLGIQGSEGRVPRGRPCQRVIRPPLVKPQAARQPRQTLKCQNPNPRPAPEESSLPALVALILSEGRSVGRCLLASGQRSKASALANDVFLSSQKLSLGNGKRGESCIRSPHPPRGWRDFRMALLVVIS
jgi:hypothetical protein